MNQMYLTVALITLFFILIIFYTYLGYGLLIHLIVKLRPEKKSGFVRNKKPTVTHIIAAYNEELFIRDKIHNALELSYPPEKYNVLVVTDGSDDTTPQITREYTHVRLLHQPERKGKIAAINRAVLVVESEIIVFSDANTILNPEAIQRIIKPFDDPGVGVVAGEKKIISSGNGNAADAGESLYWKYESHLKRLDARLYSVVGAAGELFAVRKELLSPLNENILLDDFYISLSLAMRGYRTEYVSDAYAMERPSYSISEELKRKVRIAAGGFQGMGLLLPLLNVFRYGWLSFQYISHRVLRWTLAPLGLLIVFLGCIYLSWRGSGVFALLFYIQLVFYMFALVGAVLHKNRIKNKIFYIPYYFLFMNYAIYAGFVRFLRGKQTPVWEKAYRANS